MHISREQLESAVSKWFDGSISDYECEALASAYLEHQNFRLYKYQNPFASSASIARFFSQVESIQCPFVLQLRLMIPLTVNSLFLIG